MDRHRDAINALARCLPYSINDFQAANDCFADWYRTRDPRLKKQVDLWVYLYVRQYFLRKFARETNTRSYDFDQLVEKAFRRIHAKIESVHKPHRFANWTSVICKRLFCNYLRSRELVVSIDPVVLTAEDTFGPSFDADSPLLVAAVEDCIGKMQPHLRTVARMRFLQDKSYDEIAEAMDKDVTTVRAYAHKVLQHFRRSPDIRVFVEDTRQPL